MTAVAPPARGPSPLPERDLLVLAFGVAAALIVSAHLPDREVLAFWTAGFLCMFLFGMLWLAPCAAASRAA